MLAVRADLMRTWKGRLKTPVFAPPSDCSNPTLSKARAMRCGQHAMREQCDDGNTSFRMLCASAAYLQAACAKDASGPTADDHAHAHAHGGTEANAQVYDVPYVWGIASSAGQQVREACECFLKPLRLCEDGCVARMTRVHLHRYCVLMRGVVRISG